MVNRTIPGLAAVPVEGADRARPAAAHELIQYPGSDGRFLPLSRLQAQAIMEIRINLEQHLRELADVFVGGNLFLYYAAGQADERLVLGRHVGKYISPDIIVALDSDRDLCGRETYKLWTRGQAAGLRLGRDLAVERA